MGLTKIELVDSIGAARAELEQVLAGLSDGQLLRAGEDGWSIKDHLSHLTSWRLKLLKIMQGREPWEALGLTQETYAEASLDELNRLLYERNRLLPLADVLDSFRQVHGDVLEVVRCLTEEALDGPYYADETDGRRLSEGIAENTLEHDREHREWIAAMLGRTTGSAQ